MSSAVVVRAKPSERPTEAQRPYQPFGAAERLLYCRDREVILDGPAGTGKTRACLEKVHICCTKYPGARWLMARKTRKSLTDTALVTYEEKVLPEGSPIKAGPRREQRHSYRYPNGSELVLGGLDDTTKIMSSEWDGIYVPEARELTEGDWEDLTSRLRNGVMPYQQVIGDTNPDAPLHWIKQRANRGALTLIPSRHEDNPSVTPEYLATLDALTGVRYQRLRLGKWVQAEGAIWEGWDRATHLIDRFPIPDEWPRIVTVDFGYTHPFCAQWWARDNDGRLYRYREIHYRERLVEDHAKAMAACMTDAEGKLKEPWPKQVIADWDAEDRATLEKYLALHTRRRVEVTRAIKNVSAGIQAVAVRLKPSGDGKPRLFLLRDSLVERDPQASEKKLPACTEEEIESYVWDLGNGRKRGEEPVKLNDDGCDTMRYAVAAADLTLTGAPAKARFG